jgi:hypothetical protein
MGFTGVYAITAEQAFIPGEVDFRKVSPAGFDDVGRASVDALSATITLCNKFVFIDRPRRTNGRMFP